MYVGCVVDCVCYCCVYVVDVEFIDVFGFDWWGFVVEFVEKNYVEVRNVGVNWYVVFGEVMVDE